MKKDNKKIKRSLIIEHNNGELPKELEIGKATSVDTDGEFIYFEKMKDGKWRLTFSELVVEDFSTIKGFTILREDEETPMVLKDQEQIKETQVVIDLLTDKEKVEYYELKLRLYKEKDDLSKKEQEIIIKKAKKILLKAIEREIKRRES